MTGISKTFPELVREVRRQLGISQEELAHELGVSFATINRWENGKTTPFKLAQGQFDAFCKKNDGSWGNCTREMAVKTSTSQGAAYERIQQNTRADCP